MGSDIFAKFSAYIKNPRKEANISKKYRWGLGGCNLLGWGWGDLLLLVGKSCQQEEQAGGRRQFCAAQGNGPVCRCWGEQVSEGSVG